MSKFSLENRRKSFVYAFKGIRNLFSTQHNSWIHIGITILVVVLSFLLKLNTTEWALIILCIGLVFTAEAFNTALEYLTDLASPDWNELAGKAKDVGAAAVLIASFTSAIVGFIILGNKIYILFL